MSGGKTGRFVLGIVLGLLAGGGLMLVVALVLFRDSTPALTQAAYDAAVERWDAHGPASYDLDLDLEGNRPSKIHVEVRRGQVAHMTRDGIEPRQRRTWDVWSVPGQLDTIGQELEKADHPAEGFHAPPGSRMVQRAEFDPQYGYPARYQRTILGSNLEIRWQIVQFVVRDEADEVEVQNQHQTEAESNEKIIESPHGDSGSIEGDKGMTGDTGDDGAQNPEIENRISE